MDIMSVTVFFRSYFNKNKAYLKEIGMETVFLFDGNYILRRSFYGVPELKTASGFPINAIKGTLNQILYIKNTYKPEKMIVAYDSNKPTFRHMMYNEYKSTREAAPEDFIKQYSVVSEILGIMGISVVKKEGYEADDIIGTIAKKESEKGNKVYIVSADHDMLQLINQNVFLYVPANNTQTIWTEQEVFNVYGVTPKQFTDVKALMGDKSDNIPGILGIGEKTACKLIAQYGSLMGIYTSIKDISNKRVMAKLINGWKDVFLSRALIEIKQDVQLGEYDGRVPDDMLNNISRRVLEIYELESVINILEKGGIVRL